MLPSAPAPAATICGQFSASCWATTASGCSASAAARAEIAAASARPFALAASAASLRLRRRGLGLAGDPHRRRLRLAARPGRLGVGVRGVLDLGRVGGRLELGLPRPGLRRRDLRLPRRLSQRHSLVRLGIRGLADLELQLWSRPCRGFPADEGHAHVPLLMTVREQGGFLQWTGELT